MSQNSRIFLVIVFTLFAARMLAQDVIIQKDGTKIYCRIVAEDSTSIYYTRKPQKTRFEIKKTEVERYDLPARLRKTDDEPYLSQDSVKYMHLLFSITGGIANPFGDFSNKDITFEPAGFAKTGGLFQVAAIFKFTSYFGIRLGYRYQANPVDGRAYAAGANYVFPGSTFQVDASSWIEKGLNAGVCIMLPYKKTGHWFDLSLSAAAVKCSYSEMDITTTTGRVTSFYSVSANDAKCLGLLGGIGFHYKISRNIFFNVSVNMFHAKPVFTEVHTSGSALNDVYIQRINTIGIETGFSFQVL